MRTVDSTRGILDGEAIYLSGRKLDNKRSSNKEKIVIKNTMFFESADTNSEYCAVLVELLDVLLRNITARQAEVMYYKLLSFNELQIANKMGIKQATVNQHSTAAGWNAIEHTLNYFEQIPF